MSNPSKDRPEKMYPVKFVVEGRGDFPIDMLRYDRAVPMTEHDSGVIAYESGKRRVHLIRYSAAGKSGPCQQRWDSFNWLVISIEYSDGTIWFHGGVAEQVHP